jgi:beta-galactosidase
LDGDLDAKAMMDSIRWKPYLMGGSLWTFNDYRSSFPQQKNFLKQGMGYSRCFQAKKESLVFISKRVCACTGV